MTSKDVLLRLRARLIARRNALLKALNDDFDMLRNGAGVSVVGDSVDAAVDSANGEISSQLVERDRELAQIEHALERIAPGNLRALRVLWEHDSRDSFKHTAIQR